MSENLWGDLPPVEDIRTPASILKEQATRLTEITGGVLRGKATFQQSSVSIGRVSLELRIVAPALQSYEYTVARVGHAIDQQYPLILSADIAQETLRVTCEDERDFLGALRGVLQSPKIRNVIAALLSQSKIIAKPAG